MPKPNDPLNPDNAPNPPQVPARPKDVDRDLPPDADAEERFNNFIKKNGSAIFTGIAVAAVVVLGVQIYRYMAEKAELKTREAFASAQSNEELIAFAQDHDDHPLAALSYLQLANRRYEAGDYTQAANHYQKAYEELEGTPVAGRAMLGAGMANLLGGNVEQGERILTELLGNARVNDPVRAQAGYNLALHYWQNGQMDLMRQVVETVESLEDASIYGLQVAQLRTRLPE